MALRQALVIALQKKNFSPCEMDRVILMYISFIFLPIIENQSKFKLINKK